jgi:hypothetical protein
MGMIAEGFAFGVGSSIARSVVGSVFDSFGGGGGSSEGAPPPPPAAPPSDSFTHDYNRNSGEDGSGEGGDGDDEW